MNKRILSALLCALALCLCLTTAQAQEDVYELMDESGKVVTRFCGECDAGDEYISGDNRHYRVTEVNEADKTARVELLGDAEMPDTSWLNIDESTPVAAMGEKRIALYCTHSDESYKNGDGTQSIETRGGIYDVAQALADALGEQGVTVEFSEATHHPHDAGAYRRSRQTAIALLKTQPSAMFDIHRDGIPDPDEYAVTIGGKEMSMVRLLVGKSNQNKEANLSFAKQIKAVADKVYPKLIKDIYMGKGAYNQDLAPRCVLLEFGTHTLSKQRALASTTPMSEVIYRALYGGVTGSAGASDVSGQSSGTAAGAETPAAKDNKGSGAIIWIIVALVVGLGLFAFLSTGGKGGMNKFGRSFSEMTGGLFGKKPPDKE